MAQNFFNILRDINYRIFFFHSNLNKTTEEILRQTSDTSSKLNHP
jgi:hypothetical protein